MLIDSSVLLGKTLGSCTIQRLIGRGGMGAVYLARQSRPRRTVAVKVLMPGLVMEQRPRSEFLARFRREADAIAALDHVNIMPIYEYGEQEDVAYLVMPYVTGGTLREVITREGILPLPQVVRIIEQASAALDSAHAQNIVHRDLKPGNMLFHADGRLLLADFGLAKVLRDETDESSKHQTELTSTGTIIGTPEYLSPEQGTGKELDYRTDVYSLGVVLYQMLAGRVPFTGSTPVAIALKHALEAPPPLHDFNPSITLEVEAVVLKALAKAPAQRYHSAGELAQALKEAVEHTPSTSTSLSPAPKKDAPLIIEAPQLVVPEEHQAPADIEFYPTQREPEQAKGKEMPLIDLHKTQFEEQDIHSDQTEETPRVSLPPQTPTTFSDTHHTYEPEGQKLEVSPRPAQSLPERRVQPKRQGLQSVGMLLLGSLLTLVLLVGGFGAYTQFFLKKPKTPPLVILHSQSTATIKATPTPNKHLSLPPALITNAGDLLYGTDQPGTTCDTQGGQWSSTSNAQISCSQGITLRNSDHTMLAGTFLDKLPSGKTMPNDYVLQVQVTVNSASVGDFGVFFRNQPGEKQQGTYSILLSPSNTWRAYEYENTSGTATALVKGIATQIPISGNFTIDVVVQGNTYTLYLNGAQQGYAQSDTYSSGNIGLAADGGADVTFKNLEVFTVK